MKIAFESQLFLRGNKTGIAWYAHNIIEKLLRKSENSYCFNYFSLGYTQEELAPLLEYTHNNVEMRSCTFLNNSLYKLVWPIIPIPYRWFFGNDADVTFFFNYAVSPGVCGKKVVVVYDMAYKACPETVRKKTRYWLELILKRSCRRADLIITISEFSKREIIKYLNVPQEKIAIIPCGVNVKVFHDGYKEELIDQCKQKYSIQGEYFLYLGTLEPRKNIVNIIKAYGLLKQKSERNQSIPKLVLAGGKGWYYNEIFSIVDKLKLNEEIIFTGYVLTEEVPLLMNGAKVFLFPSLYEGFGMPPLEAMACGTPVIVSNAASLPEVVGDAGITVDSTDVGELCDMMDILIHDKQRYDELKAAGLQRVKDFEWDKITDKLCDVLINLI